MATGNRDTEGKGPKRGGGEQQGGRRKRTVYSKEQVDILIKAFQSHPYPSFCMREKLARMMGLQESRLHVWFQNRRARQPKKPSGTPDANKCQNLPAPNFCPPGQPTEMQSNATTAAAPNPAVSTSSLPGRNWHLDSHSMQYWESQEASFQYQSSSFGTDSTVHVSQSNFGRDVVNRGMPLGLEGAGTLPTVPQPGQGTFCRNAQSDMNYLNPAQPLLRPLGNLQLGEQVCAPYFQCSGSAPNLCGMADAMSHFNCTQTMVKEGNVHTQASSPSVQWQEAAQEEAYPFRVYECPLQETTHYSTNWLGTENELLRSSLGLALENDQTQQQSEGADSSFSLPFSTETFT